MPLRNAVPVCLYLVSYTEWDPAAVKVVARWEGRCRGHRGQKSKLSRVAAKGYEVLFYRLRFCIIGLGLLDIEYSI